MQIDFSSQVKATLTMPQVLSAYGISISSSGKAICPFHDDKNASMKVYRDGYHCYACGAYGDVIDFVKGYFNLSHLDALRRLNTDFALSLPLDLGRNHVASQRANTAAIERRNQIDQQKTDQARLEAEYHKWFDLWIELDKIKKEQIPQNFLEDITDDYAKACRNIDYVNYRVELALQKLSEFEQKVKPNV